jgi:hypothetical protein
VIHDRMTTFIEPRDCDEYLTPTERPPLLLAAHSPGIENETATCECDANYGYIRVCEVPPVKVRPLFFLEFDAG